MIKIAAGCYFEQEEDEPIDPIIGRKGRNYGLKEPIYRRRSTLEDIPDNYVERMMKRDRICVNKPIREITTPDGFAVTIAYNKSGYQVVPKEDLKSKSG
jgi:hypothetical protein